MQNLNHLVSLLQEGYKTIGVVFSAAPQAQPIDIDIEPIFPSARNARQAGPQVYTYKCHFECMPGDLVILPPSSEGKLPSIGTVVRVDDEPELNFESGIEYTWAVARVDFSQYEQIIGSEKKMIKILRDGEKQAARKRLLESYQLSLPEDGEARKIFDQARQIGLTSKD